MFDAFINPFGLRSGNVLDYGCGAGKLAKAVHRIYEGFRIDGYDPCVSRFSYRPTGRFDGVVCLDVLEHIEPDLIGNVLRDILSFSDLFFFNIALCESNKTLPIAPLGALETKGFYGRNAHLIIQPSVWWKEKLTDLGLLQLEELENEKTSTNPKLVFLTGIWKRRECVL